MEHLSRAEARKLVRESLRVLVPGGVIRIIVPDLRTCLKKYMKAFHKWDVNCQELPPAEIFLEHIDMYDPGLMDQPFWIRVHKKLYDKNTHKWACDEQSLAYLLKAAGFRDICKRRYGESLIENVTSLDLPERFEGSICFEAVK